MTNQKISRVGVVGAGQMGAGIAEVCARAHADVLVYEHSRELVVAGRARILRSLDRGVSSGKLTERERDQASMRLRFTTDLGDFADRHLVCEAVVEDEVVKTEIFAQLDKVVTDPGAILASNTSSIPIMKLGMATQNTARVIGMHFFNPVPVLPLVELVTTLTTAPEIVERAEAFAHDVLGKQVVRSADRSGFVVNALLVPYLLSSIRMVESGVATVDDIDKAMVLGCAHPMGPLKLADLVGLDTIKAIADRMYEEFKEPLYAPPPLLLRMVEAGRLGKKADHGFYRYA
ncbi:3-hydroxybutyryl-CoA dehydrogenase [Gordonia hongkongensis]|uniref:3-hydroxybutyryl-CoA dehydrogenase n=1 Tax=Gordonia hongkongensis TaxID=1701090 RepID=A0AAX3T9L7_9ACTN|nr:MULTISPECIES: 3-hydroxybutyryl-CoA dehydrogenase [Gordonia]OCW85470.1 3-hydroxybutyryl-CoA dehydrogenase [Nocardia farcinica]QIK49506.1 3-hydroxybutyryl-CoA dehydrogenase [Gordonia terrae]MBR7192405.1 3-hydroxybutyryl-CoA dehydrogenase [Gordonia sp. SCSIO 19800]MDF6102040.1 3-hydroxybutyryl-CoA dehydrogenase [Gordonia hongkongensis]UPG68952.1 3-hydroxybutyryl-CoA dehydrogenase [Gordonia hongkongensis]